MKKALLIPSLAVLLLASPVLGQDLVINEIFYDEDGSDVGCFTEIKGEPSVDLTRYVLAGINGNGGVVYATVPLTGIVPADGYYVVGQDTLVVEADQIDPNVNWQNGADQVQLWLITAAADTILIDSICYGSTGDLVCEGGTAGPDVGAGFSISRCPDGTDTDDNEADTQETVKTPGGENDCIIIEPTDRTVCEIQEVDANGFPVLFGELVHIIDPFVLVSDNLIYDDDRLEVYGTDGECCTELFDFNIVFEPYVAGQTFDVTGRVDFYNGKIQVTDVTLVDLGMSPVPDPLVITTGELATNGEATESCLIKLCHLEIIEGTWPDEGSDANLTVDDGSGPVTLRVDKDTDIDGSPAPEQPFACVGISGQFDNESPYFDGYQILPRGLQDILPDCDPTAVEQTTWGQIKSRYND
jgi:hypothetical protein